MRRIVFCLGLALMPVLSLAATVEDPSGLERLRVAAGGGDVEAMLELGILYEFGFRMPDNKAPALAWYRLATEAGSAKASERHDALKATMTAAEVEEAARLYQEYAAQRQTTPAAVNSPAATTPTAPAAEVPAPATTP